MRLALSKNPACGDCNPRVRRLASPRAAFGIPACGVCNSPFGMSLSARFRHASATSICLFSYSGLRFAVWLTLSIMPM